MQRTVWRYRSKRIAGTLYGLFYPFFCIGWVLLCLNGCSQEVVPGGEPEVSEGELAVIRLNVRANTTDQISTRAINDSTIHDLHILVYNSAGELTGKSYKTAAPYTVTARSGTNCKIYAIANTGSSALFDGTVVSTEQKLKDLTTNIASWNSMGISNYLLMTGSKTGVTIAAGESTLTGGMTVSRLAAKVNLVIGVAAGSGITITNYKICSLPVNSYYINRPLTTEASQTDNAGETGTEPNSKSTAAHWTNSGLISVGGASSVNTTFYMFENRRGVNSSIAAQNQKIKANAPDSATYVVINGEGSGFKATWKVYLGANNTSNFNVKRNCSYKYTITLKRNDVDSRVKMTQIGSSSNCYMITPGNAITIPVSRANESPIAINGATLSGGTYHQILSNTSWTASLLWESVVGLISISDAMGMGPEGRFTVTANTPASNNGGNAVVQIKNSSDQVLWSWHIWVTGYDPNSGGTTYSRSNGTKTYVFMDRNLGATAAATSTATDQASAVSGLLYQWGRKDPFPGANSWNITNGTDPTAVYSPSGTSMNVLANVQAVSASENFTNSIRNPFVFYKGTDWYTNGGSQNNDLWGGSTISVTTFASKTVFDPCPAGWRVPPWTGSKSPWNGYSSNSFSNYGILLTGIGYYPAAGSRNISMGAFIVVSTDGYCWSASPNSTYGYNLVFYSSGVVSPANFNNRASGFAVRCVQE